MCSWPDQWICQVPGASSGGPGIDAVSLRYLYPGLLASQNQRRDSLRQLAETPASPCASEIRWRMMCGVQSKRCRDSVASTISWRRLQACLMERTGHPKLWKSLLRSWRET